MGNVRNSGDVDIDSRGRFFRIGVMQTGGIMHTDFATEKSWDISQPTDVDFDILNDS